jgi:hypothetical protein
MFILSINHDIPMRSLFFVFALCAAFVGTTVEGWAGAFGSSIMNVSNLRLQYRSGVINGVDVWDNATSAQAGFVGSLITSSSFARLAGMAPVTSVNVPNLDAPQSFVSPSLAPPPVQTSAPLSGLVPSLIDSFAYGDTWGNAATPLNPSGATLTSVGGISSSTLAQVNALPPLAGSAFGNISNQSQFDVRIYETGRYRLAFQVDLAMESIGDGFATNAFRMQGAQTSSSGGSVGFDDDNVEFPTLNGRIDGTATRIVTGTFFSSESTFEATFDPSLDPTGAGVVLFTITQASRAGVSVVPEPSSFAIFGLMSVGSLAAWRRRRAGERKSAEA